MKIKETNSAANRDLRGASDMKIYDKSSFALGVLFGCALLFFAFGIIPYDWWQLLITLAISGRYLYIGLSQKASKNVTAVRQHHNETAVRLYGKYALVKTNLPIILLVTFFSVALFLRVAFDVLTPVYVAVIFCVLLAVSVLYSSSLEHKIKDAILTEESESKKQE